MLHYFRYHILSRTNFPVLDILFNRRSQSCKDTHIVYHLKTLKLHIPVILFHSSICAEKHFFPSCWLGEHLWWHLVKHKNKSTQCKFNWLYSQECSQFDVSASAVSSREAVCSQGVSALSFYNIIHIKLGSKLRDLWFLGACFTLWNW